MNFFLNKKSNKKFSKNPLTRRLIINNINIFTSASFTTNLTIKKAKNKPETSLQQIERLLTKRNNRPSLFTEGLAFIGEKAASKMSNIFNSLTIENFRLVKFYLYILVGIILANFFLLVISGDIAVTFVQPQLNSFWYDFWNQKAILPKLKFLYQKIDLMVLILIIGAIWGVRVYFELVFFAKFFIAVAKFTNRWTLGHEYLLENNFFEIRRILSAKEIQEKVQTVFKNLSIPKELSQDITKLIEQPTSEISNWYMEFGSRVANVKVKDLFVNICETKKHLLSKVPEIVADPTINDTLTQIGGFCGFAILSVMLYFMFK